MESLRHKITLNLCIIYLFINIYSFLKEAPFGSWLSLGCHGNIFALGLCDYVRGCRDEFVAAFGSQS